MEEASIFTQIINGDIPAHKVYENDHTLAFLDIHPSRPGHTLVVPKKQVAYIWDMEPGDYDELMRTAQKVGKVMRRELGVPFVGIKVVGVDVPHTHVHLIPFSTVDEYRQEADLLSEPDHETLAVMAQRLHFDD